jgi:ABC-type Na+ efflux pump permease subunit
VLNQTRALLTKELRQARRSRGALISTVVLSLLLIVVTPSAQLFALTAGGRLPMGLGVGLPSLLGGDTRSLFGAILMPLFATMAGLLVPSVAAVHTVVVERERRSVELLIALPVRVRDILIAKLLATLALSSAVLFVAPESLRILALVGLLLAVGLAAAVIALRWLTFERYLL